MNWTKTANIKGEPGNAGLRGSKLTVQTANPQDSLIYDWNIDPETGDLYSYEKSKTQFATFDNSTGTLRFWNRETVPSVGDEDPEGHNVDSVFTELNYQNNYQSVFSSIAENLKTAIVVDRVSFTDTSWMFNNCQSLTNLDLSNFDTSKVTDMSSMFYGCSSLTNLDLHSFDTSKVTDMSSMFYGCSSLTNLDLHSFDTSKVTNMYNMFGSCSSLTTLDLSNFDTSNVTGMDSMFQDSSGLTTLDLSNFDTSNVTGMNNMFYGCSGLTTLGVSSFDTSNVTHMQSMFQNCSNLTLDCSHWNVDKVVVYDRFNRDAPNVIPPVWKN